MRNRFRNRSGKRKKRGNDQREADEKYREWLEKNKQKPTESASAEGEEGQEENSDQSVYEPDNPEATQEDDMEEDLALLDEEDDLW
ncbi:MAG: hypothetical protein ABSF44_00020 [Candidatus Bathyarchaeia archaeon]